jgi:hypothetical protein
LFCLGEPSTESDAKEPARIASRAARRAIWVTRLLGLVNERAAQRRRQRMSHAAISRAQLTSREADSATMLSVNFIRELGADHAPIAVELVRTRCWGMLERRA